MAVRECLIPDRGSEAQEEVIADLNTCLEQLIQRSTDMESRIDMCMKKAACHLKSSKKENTTVGKNKELSRAKLYMEDKRRIQAEYDKTQRSIHMLQQQIDCIISSHTDMVIVDTMRQFNATAARLSLPNKTKEVEGLGEELSERKGEVSEFQEAMQEISRNAMGDSSNESDESLMMQELEDYLKFENESSTSSSSIGENNRRSRKMIISEVADNNNSNICDNDDDIGVDYNYRPEKVVLPSVPNNIPPLLLFGKSKLVQKNKMDCDDDNDDDKPRQKISKELCF